MLLLLNAGLKSINNIIAGIMASNLLDTVSARLKQDAIRCKMFALDCYQLWSRNQLLPNWKKFLAQILLAFIAHVQLSP